MNWKLAKGTSLASEVEDFAGNHIGGFLGLGCH